MLKYSSKMKNETISELQKRKIEDVDDSFEFFLPNKLREKPKPIKSGHSHRNNKTLTKRKKYSSASSSSSQESFDTDIEKILDMCLSKDTSIRSDTIRRTDSISDWNKIKGKMKRQPILMTRSMEEREVILSQKLALILVTNEVDGEKYSKIDLSCLVNSERLLQQWCKDCRLWSASREPFLKINEFYLSALSKYLEINENNLETLNTEKIYYQSVNLALNDEIFSKSPSPVQHEMINNSEIDIFECDDKIIGDQFKFEEKSSCINVSSSESKDIDTDCQLIIQTSGGFIAEPSTSCYSSNLVNSPKTSCTSVDLISTSSPSSSRTSFKCVPESSVSNSISEDSGKTLFPYNNYISSDEDVEQIKMLDRVGVSLLAEQWDNLFSTDSGDVTVLLASNAILKIHKIVLTVRCQPLVTEISEDFKIEWCAYNLQSAKAFFRYVYTGKCDHLWNLDSADKITVKLLSHLYKQTHLEQVFLKFHSSRPFSQLEGINHLNDNGNQSLHLEYSTQFHSPSKLVNDSESEKEDDQIIGKEDMVRNEKISEYNKELSKPYQFRSPSPNFQVNFSSPQDSRENYEPATKKRSLEKYFQDSFPDLSPAYGDLKSPSVNFNFSPSHSVEGSSFHGLQNEKFVQSTPSVKNICITSLAENISHEKNEHCISTRLDTLSNGSSLESLTSNVNRPLLTPNDLNISTYDLTTPSTSSGIIFSKIATPFPEYDSMITPHLKRELKKFGLRSDLGATKAKLLLKYIYEQTHPIVESTIRTEDTQVQISSNNENAESLKEIICRLIKRNKLLYTHLLLFRPVWFQDFYELLKDNGIICSKNELKDTLNDLCITYRTENVENINLNKKSRKRRNMIL